jgi:predicted metal-dependent HD superfamily phosphohydrolase
MADLQLQFQQLVLPFTGHPEVAYELWLELEKAHSEKGRHYHNFTHLENLFAELNGVRDQINDWDTVSFSVFYHDAVYNVRKQDNEERSADWAVSSLKGINYPPEKIARCKAQIIATKSHNLLDDTDANLFTDADLSILGKDWNTYEAYVKNIRKEYKIYPNVLYKVGRKKVLKHFLEMERIFKTDYFSHKYEVQARENLTRELG